MATQGNINYMVSLTTGTVMQTLSALRARFEGLGKVGAKSLAMIASPAVGLVKGLGALNQAMEGVGRLMTPLRGVADEIMNASKAAATLEATKVGFEVMIGSAEKTAKVLAELKDLEIKTPLLGGEIRESAQLLLNFNVAAEEVTDTIRRLGDVSAVRKNLDQVALIFGQVKAKGRLQGEEMLQFAEAGVPVLGELAKMLGTTEGNVTNLIEAGKIGFPLVNQAFTNMTSEGGKFANMMQSQSTTTQGVLSNLQGQIDVLRETFGKPINDALRPIMTDLIQWAQDLRPKVQEIGEKFRDWSLYIRQAFKGGYGLEAVFAPVKLWLLEAADSFVGAMDKGVAGVVDRFKLAMGAALKDVPGLGSIGEKMMMQGIMGAVPHAMDTGPFGAQIEALKKRIEEMKASAASDLRLDAIVDEFQAYATEWSAKLNNSGDGGAKKVADDVAAAMKVAQNALNDPGGKRLRAMLDYGKAVQVAELKLKGLNKEAAKLEREQKLREKIAKIMEDTGAKYEDAAKAAKKLMLVEEGAPARKTGTERADERRQANREALDMRRQARRDESADRNAAAKAKRQTNGLDWLKANERLKLPDMGAATKFPGLDWLKRGRDAVNKAMDKPQPKEKVSEETKVLREISTTLGSMERRLATV